jgi:predicted RNA methylase
MSLRGPRYERMGNEAYYTPPSAVRPLLSSLPLFTLTKYTMWECAAGAGHIAREFAAVCDVMATDVSPSKHQVFPVKPLDFLNDEPLASRNPLAIITNPPYGEANRQAIAFLRRALHLASAKRGLVAMLLPFEFDAAGSRDELVGGHPAFAAKITCAQRIRWLNLPQKKAGPMAHHSWFVWSFDRPMRQKIRREPMRTL